MELKAYYADSINYNAMSSGVIREQEAGEYIWDPRK